MPRRRELTSRDVGRDRGGLVMRAFVSDSGRDVGVMNRVEVGLLLRTTTRIEIPKIHMDLIRGEGVQLLELIKELSQLTSSRAQVNSGNMEGCRQSRAGEGPSGGLVKEPTGLIYNFSQPHGKLGRIAGQNCNAASMSVAIVGHCGARDKMTVPSRIDNLNWAEGGMLVVFCDDNNIDILELSHGLDMFPFGFRPSVNVEG